MRPNDEARPVGAEQQLHRLVPSAWLSIWRKLQPSSLNAPPKPSQVCMIVVSLTVTVAVPPVIAVSFPSVFQYALAAEVIGVGVAGRRSRRCRPWSRRSRRPAACRRTAGRAGRATAAALPALPVVPAAAAGACRRAGGSARPVSSTQAVLQVWRQSAARGAAHVPAQRRAAHAARADLAAGADACRSSPQWSALLGTAHRAATIELPAGHAHWRFWQAAPAAKGCRRRRSCSRRSPCSRTRCRMASDPLSCRCRQCPPPGGVASGGAADCRSYLGRAGRAKSRESKVRRAICVLFH